MDDNAYKFNVKFDKSSHDIDTETYIQALTSLTSIVKEANYQLATDQKITINVQAQTEGSFDVDLVLKAVEGLFSRDNVAYLSGLVGIATGLYALRKIHHKKDDTKTEINGDDVTIKDVGGNVLYNTTKNTYHIYTNNQVVQDALSNHFKSMKNDESIDAFEIHNNEEELKIERDEFAELSKHVDIKPEDREVTEIPVELIIVKVVFEGVERKWEFLYNGNKIGATVQDDAFWEGINNGSQTFAKGDALVADLRIFREFDQNVGAYYNKEYQVINVREHHPRAYREQLSIDGIE